MGDPRTDPQQIGQDGSRTGGGSPAPDEEASNARWNDDGGFEPDATDDAPATPPVHGATDRLFLRGVLDSALPHELGTGDEPARYTVAAVFSRRVSAEERALIEAPSTLAALAERGYPGVGLKVADRRLEITRTSLEMLAAGLAGEIAAVLRDVEEQIVAARERRAEEVLRWRTAEAARAARVKAEADRVRFE